MDNRALLFLATLATALVLHGCAPKVVKTVEFGDPQAAPRVLIATEQSEFKQALTANVINGFKGEPLFFKVTDLRNLESEPVEFYRVVVIISTCVAWQLNKRVTAFIDKTGTPEKIILLTTAGDADWETEQTDIDAFTAASIPADAGRIADMLRTRIYAILNGAS